MLPVSIVLNFRGLQFCQFALSTHLYLETFPEKLLHYRIFIKIDDKLCKRTASTYFQSFCRLSFYPNNCMIFCRIAWQNDMLESSFNWDCSSNLWRKPPTSVKNTVSRWGINISIMLMIFQRSKAYRQMLIQSSKSCHLRTYSF